MDDFKSISGIGAFDTAAKYSKQTKVEANSEHIISARLDDQKEKMERAKQVLMDNQHILKLIEQIIEGSEDTASKARQIYNLLEGHFNN